MRRNSDGQLIVTIGVILAFTLMLIISNAVNLLYVRIGSSYREASSRIGEYSDLIEAFIQDVEWSLNSNLYSQKEWRQAVVSALENTVHRFDVLLSRHGIEISEELNSAKRHDDDVHLIDLDLNLTLQDAYNRIIVRQNFTILNLASDQWFHSPPHSFNYRIPVVLDPGLVRRENTPLSIMLNLQTLLSGYGSLMVDPTSLTVVEHGRDGLPMKVLPTQFSGGVDNGEVIWIADGVTPPGRYRYFYIYLDVVDGEGAHVAPPGDLSISPDGWVNNSQYSLQLRTGETIRLKGHGTPGSIGIGKDAWVFQEGSNITGTETVWETWDVLEVGDVRAKVRSTYRNMTRYWTFYANTTLIEIRDAWSVAGDGRYDAAFYTKELRYCARALPFAQGIVDTVTEPTPPTAPFAGDLAYIAHHNNFLFYSYIYPLFISNRTNWAKKVDVETWEVMHLFQNPSMAARYYLFMAYGSLNPVEEKALEVATSYGLMRFPVHRTHA